MQKGTSQVEGGGGRGGKTGRKGGGRCIGGGRIRGEVGFPKWRKVSLSPNFQTKFTFKNIWVLCMAKWRS